MKVRALMMFSLLLGFAATGFADTYNLNSTRDGWVYSFAPTGTITTSGFGPPGVLSIGRSDVVAGGVHDLNSLIQFNITSVTGAGVTASQVSNAQLVLTTADLADYAVAHSNAPTPSQPFAVDVYAAAAAWTGSTNWNTQPATKTGSPVDSESLTGTSNGASLVLTTFDVTSIVKDWINGAGSGGYANNGFVLKGAGIVGNVDDGYISALFKSRGYFDTNQDGFPFVLQSGGPLLVINTVPEPSSVVLFGLAAAGLVGWGYKRRGRRS